MTRHHHVVDCVRALIDLSIVTCLMYVWMKRSAGLAGLYVDTERICKVHHKDP